MRVNGDGAGGSLLGIGFGGGRRGGGRSSSSGGAFDELDFRGFCIVQPTSCEEKNQMEWKDGSVPIGYFFPKANFRR